MSGNWLWVVPLFAVFAVSAVSFALFVIREHRVRNPHELPYRAYQAWRNGAAADGTRHRWPVVSASPRCPLCGSLFPLPVPEARFNAQVYRVACPGTRTIEWHDDMLGPVVSAVTLKRATVPCGWSGEALFSHSQR